MRSKRRPTLGSRFEMLEDRLNPTADPFTLVALPDTQYYAQIASLNYIFYAQTQWIVDHRVDQNIRFVTALGDIVNNSTTAQYAVADAAYDILDGNLAVNPDGIVPYSPTMGNHDFTTISDRSTGAPLYIENFGPQRFAGRSWYGGSYRDLNHYQFFSGGGYNFLQISLEYEAPDDVLDWAREVIRTHPGMPTIISTHSYVYDVSESRRITRQSSDGNSGESVFRKLVYPNPQVFMVLSAHFDSSTSATPAPTPGEYHQTSTNILGLPVFEMVSDYQYQYEKASGLLRLIRFDPEANQIQVKTYSPTQDIYQTGPGSQFNFDVDFASRFAVASPDAVRVSAFQEGVNLGFPGGTYTGTRDTQLLQANANANLADDPADILVDWTSGSNAAHSLLRFDNIIGNGLGQVPPGSRILNATLTVDSNNPGAGAKMHRMVADWNESATWNSMGSGVQANGTEARTTFDSQAGVAALTPLVPNRDMVALNVTPDVAAWVAGETNHGWAFLPWTNGTDGWAFAPSESATPTLRPKLRIEWMPAETSPVGKTVVFQQGVGGYTGTVDTYLAQLEPTTDYSTAPRLFVDVPDPSATNTAMALLRFDNLFGVFPTQIRPDATIDRAYLYLTTPYNDANSEGGGAAMHHSLLFWNNGITWGNSFGGDGIQADNVEVRSVPALNTGSVDFGVFRIDVTDSLRSWQSGETNLGWAFLPNNTDGWFVGSSEAEAVYDRPRLEVLTRNRPPRVESVVVNGGDAQRSRVTTLQVNFSTQVYGPGGAAPTPSLFELKRTDGLAADVSTNVQTTGGKTVVTLYSFTGPGALDGTLLDGRWTLRVKNPLTNAYVQPLDGNGDDTAGDDYLLTGTAANGLFRLFGDINGDGTVDGATDFTAFGNVFNVTLPDSPFDFNIDGIVDSFDFAQFGARFNFTI